MDFYKCKQSGDKYPSVPHCPPVTLTFGVAEQQYSCTTIVTDSIPSGEQFLQNRILHVQTVRCQISLCSIADELSESIRRSELRVRV